MLEKDPINWNTIITYLFGGGMILALYGWIIRTLFNIPREYVSKDDFKDLKTENKDGHDKIFDKIDDVQKSINKHLNNW